MAVAVVTVTAVHQMGMLLLAFIMVLLVNMADHRVVKDLWCFIWIGVRSVMIAL